MVANALIAGCGYIGCALAERLVAASHNVWGLRRSPAPLPAGAHAIAADLNRPESLAGLPAGLDFVFYLASPGGAEDARYRAAYVEGLRHLLRALERQKQRPARVFFASSTAVYAGDDAGWVDETSPATPTHFGGVRLLQAEELLRRGPFPGCAVRFGGIYGPGRERLIERVRSGRAVCREGPPRYGNRIHRADCAGSLQHLMGLERPAELYLGVDCEPAEECAVLRWLAAELGAPEPRRVRGAERPGPRPRTNKRCRNARLLASGYTFRYPSFREGYRALLAASG